MIARLWPVSAVVGENGAFFFRYDRLAKRMLREYQRSGDQRRADQVQLAEILVKVKERYPDIQLSADQPFRISDYAIDFCEDITRLPAPVVEDIVRIFEAHGATAKISSIHINAWIGRFSKLEMSLSLLERVYHLTSEEAQRRVLYIGDSPNDEPMFEFFPLSVGVANIAPMLRFMKTHPRWISSDPGGHGFAHLADLLAAERGPGKKTLD
jgi:hydroxymethylpyrimidine pyrophosphatase-like HAD family hydrolase